MGSFFKKNDIKNVIVKFLEVIIKDFFSRKFDIIKVIIKFKIEKIKHNFSKNLTLKMS